MFSFCDRSSLLCNYAFVSCKQISFYSLVFESVAGCFSTSYICTKERKNSHFNLLKLSSALIRESYREVEKLSTLITVSG